MGLELMQFTNFKCSFKSFVILLLLGTGKVVFAQCTSQSVYASYLKADTESQNKAKSPLEGFTAYWSARFPEATPRLDNQFSKKQRSDAKIKG